MRESMFINRRQAHNFAHAIEHAQTYGPELNVLATINFNHTDCPPERASAQFERLRDNHFTRWLRYRTKGTLPPTYVWVIENMAGQTHVHWVLHVPQTLRPQFDEKLALWVAKTAGAINNVSAINIKPTNNVPGLRKYLLKGINPALAPLYKIKPKANGVVRGKRCGVSKILGPTAIKRVRLAHQHKYHRIGRPVDPFARY